jgi:hypothetical protein
VLLEIGLDARETRSGRRALAADAMFSEPDVLFDGPLHRGV